jgi:hypothetical protein
MIVIGRGRLVKLVPKADEGGLGGDGQGTRIPDAGSGGRPWAPVRRQQGPGCKRDQQKAVLLERDQALRTADVTIYLERAR